MTSSLSLREAEIRRAAKWTGSPASTQQILYLLLPPFSIDSSSSCRASDVHYHLKVLLIGEGRLH